MRIGKIIIYFAVIAVLNFQYGCMRVLCARTNVRSGHNEARFVISLQVRKIQIYKNISLKTQYIYLY